ncbi:calmodulin-binding protein 60 B-like isoform X2 [Phragmites australis]|uniref:calmodulin-binding protein 60 B-like isoform X2 n=1 Tax=Phragmites australis TaxID=29695 RepID=UPI002D76F2E4|nr:calmodulin-binding protein 60 B-like isoform X2 [Phragmites australis]
MSLSRPRRGRDEEEDGRAGGEDPRGSAPAKRPRRCSSSCSCCQETQDFCESQIKILRKEMQLMSKGFIEECRTLQREMREFYQNSRLQFKEQISERMEQLIREQFNTLISRSTPGDHLPNVRALSHPDKIRTCRLKFENKCCGDKYSGHVITADDRNPIKVAIYDHDNRIITDGPLSSMQVKIVVLDGEFNKENKEQWSEDSFLKSIIVCGRTGKPPLFANEPYLRLKNGVAKLCDVKFQDNVPSKKFRLGVMAADDSISEKILEGISDSFSIKSGRGFLNKKDPHPSLSDPIYKLKKIAENGDRHKLLQQKHINLVRDFLRFYNKDKNSLRKACGNVSDHDWDIIVGHALNCKPEDVLYSYCIPEMGATIFFNSLYTIVGAEFNGIFTSYEELYGTQKELVEKSKTTAYDNMEVVQYEYRDPCHENEVIAGGMGSCYQRGSRSMLPSPTLPTRIHDERSYNGEVLESRPAQEIPGPHQRWVKAVTVVTTLRFWNKESAWSLMREMISIP